MTLPHFDFKEGSATIYYLISVIAAFATAVGVILKLISKISKVVKEKYLYIESSFDKIEKIFAEITPNHGSSIKDKINSIDGQLSKNTEITEKIFHRQRWIMDIQTIPVFETDKDGNYIWANSHYLALVGRDLLSILGNGWRNVILQEERDKVVHHWETCIKEKVDVEETFTILDTDGQKIRVLCCCRRTSDAGYIGSFKVLK